MNFVAYLINLDGSAERLQNATEELANAGINFVRIPAFDGRGKDPKQIVGYNDVATRRFMGRSLKGGEIGCYKSHLDCAQRFLDTNQSYGLVFEDDIRVDQDFYDIVSKAIEWLESTKIDWELIHLGADKLKIYTHLHSLEGVQPRDLVQAHYFPMTTSALLWSRAGALNFVSNYAEICMPVDNLMREIMVRSNKGLTIWPPLVAQRGMESDIDGGQKRKLGGRTWDYGILKQKRLLMNKFIAFLHKLKVAKPNRK